MKNRLLIFSLIILLGMVYWRWFLPGPKVASDFPLISESFLKYYSYVPYAWLEVGADALGEYSTFFLWGWPLAFLISTIARFGLDFAFIEKFAFLIPTLIIGSFGIWKIGKEFKLSSISCIISSFFYLTNTYIILVIDGGQLQIALAYAWFPLSFLLLKKSVENGIRSKILAGVGAAILGFFDLRFLYVLLILAVIFFLYQAVFVERKKIKEFISNCIKSLFILSLVVLGMNFFWIYPLIKVPISSSTYQFFTQTSFTSFGNLGHSILALAPNWFINVYGKITPLRIEFIFIPIIIFLAPLLKVKNQNVGFWMIVAIISIFLSKGTAEPFPQIYQWLFKNIPGFSLFRDSTKFFFLLMLSYSILLGISTDEVLKRLAFNKKIKSLFLILVISYLLFLVKPVIFGEMRGTFSNPVFQQEYSSLTQFLESDKTSGRVFWIPSFPPLGLADLNHPRIEAARAVQKRIFAQGTKGTYEIFNFLREAPYMGEIFDIAGIEYIVYTPLNPRKDDLHPDNVRYYNTFSEQLSELKWLSKIPDSKIPLFKVKVHQEKFFITPNTWWVIGSDNLINEATKSANLRLAKNALIFVEEQQGLGSRLEEVPDAKIILNNKTITDLMASFIPPENLIFPANQLEFHPNISGWWKRRGNDLISWREFLQTKYNIDNQDFDLGGGWAISEGKLELKVKSEKIKKDKILLARVMESSRSGQISFYQQGDLIANVNTKNLETNVRWIEVGQLSQNEEVIITTDGDINVVNALAVLDKQEWVAYQSRGESYKYKILEFNEKNTTEFAPTITFKQINPTKYKISINNLTNPAFLVFSDNFDKLWKLEGKIALPVFNLLNGFRVDKNGDYTLEFEAQKYIYPSLAVSLFSVLVIIIFLVI